MHTTVSKMRKSRGMDERNGERARERERRGRHKTRLNTIDKQQQWGWGAGEQDVSTGWKKWSDREKEGKMERMGREEGNAMVVKREWVKRSEALPCRVNSDGAWRWKHIKQLTAEYDLLTDLHVRRLICAWKALKQLKKRERQDCRCDCHVA